MLLNSYLSKFWVAGCWDRCWAIWVKLTFSWDSKACWIFLPWSWVQMLHSYIYLWVTASFIWIGIRLLCFFTTGHRKFVSFSKFTLFFTSIFMWKFWSDNTNFSFSISSTAEVWTFLSSPASSLRYLYPHLKFFLSNHSSTLANLIQHIFCSSHISKNQNVDSSNQTLF